MSKVRRTHTREFKLDLCRRIDLGVISKAQACREYRLAPSMLDRWTTQFKERGTEAFSAAPSETDNRDLRITQLEQALGQAYLDIKLLKEAVKKRGPVPCKCCS